MIGAKTVSPGFADSFREIGVVVNYGFKRSHGGIGLKGLLHKIAKVDHVLIIIRGLINALINLSPWKHWARRSSESGRGFSLRPRPK